MLVVVLGETVVSGKPLVKEVQQGWVGHLPFRLVVVALVEMEILMVQVVVEVMVIIIMVTWLGTEVMVAMEEPEVALVVPSAVPVLGAAAVGS
jgi:hypothetical protein